MKKIIVANWKSHKTIKDASSWLKNLKTLLEESTHQIILAPDFISLPVVAGFVRDTSLALASQDISAYPAGSYTGEVSGKSLKDLVSFALIGHSERRRFFAENTPVIIKKVNQALKAEITPIVCFENTLQAQEYVYLKGSLKKLLVAYEPPEFIGTGQPQPLGDAQKDLDSFQEIFGKTKEFLYGGSVDSHNITPYLKIGYRGALVGSASLNPLEFAKIIKCVTLI